jgi:iron complex outermembrane receptor protein
MLKYRRPIKTGYLDWLMGAEAQQGLTGVQIYSTRGGLPDTLQTDDKLHIRSAMAFTQAALSLHRWLFVAGVSISNNRVRYARLTNSPYAETIRDFNNEAAPRIAVSYGISDATTVYASAARGFSPPTSAELSPSGKSLNDALQPERGWNYEAGVRGTLLRQWLSYELTAYHFGLANTIVQRRDSLGGDYFINSGSTEQMGIELALRYRILEASRSNIGNISAFASYSYQHYRYTDFRQVTADYSGNAMPGISPNTIAAGIDWESHIGLYARLSYFYADITPLNDANSEALASYQLLGARIGYKLPRESPYGLEVFAGAENIGDVKYSAGADINGFTGRYYNAAPGRNFYAGIALHRNR